MTQDTLTQNNNPIRLIGLRAWLAVGLVAVLLGVAFKDVAVWMYDRWVHPDSYYSHGFLVPPIVLFIIWRDRMKLMAARRQGSLIGLVTLLVGLLLLYLSGTLTIFFVGAFGMILTIWGLAGFLFGPTVFRRLLFPMFILTFMVPMPLQMIANISYKMKIMAADGAVVMLDWLGILSVREGSTLLVGDASVTVGNACSGLRSLISLIFLGVLFAYMSNLTWPRRILLFLASFPIAIVANVVRVFALTLIAYHYGGAAIQGQVHDISGYAIFVVAFILLFGALKLLSIGLKSAKAEPAEGQAADAGKSRPAMPVREMPGTGKGEAAEGSDGPTAGSGPPPRGSLLRRFVVGVVLLCLGASASALLLYPTQEARGVLQAEQLPLRLEEWIGISEPVHEEEKIILETDDIIHRKYLNFANTQYKGSPVFLAVVYSPDNRRVAHPPEVCYKGSGWELVDKRIVEHEGLPPMARLVLGGPGKHDLVYYHFKAGDLMTPSYMRQQLNIVVNQLMKKATSSALVRYSTRVNEPSESIEQAEARLTAFITAMTPEIRSTLD